MTISDLGLNSEELIQGAIYLLSEADTSQRIGSEGLTLSDKGMAFCDEFAKTHGQGAHNQLLHFTARQVNALHRDADDLMPGTATVNLAADEVAVVEMALDALDQRIAERDMDLGKDHDWQEGVQVLRQKLTAAAEQLPDAEANGLDDLMRWLSAGDEELAILLGVEPNTEGRTVEELKNLWVSKVEAAGLDAKTARHFLDSRLKTEGVA